MLCSCSATHCLLLGRACCLGFQYMQRAKPMQNMKVLFVLLCFEGMSYYNPSIPEDFCITFAVH